MTGPDLKDKDIFQIPAEDADPVQLEALKAKVLASVQRIRKARGDKAEADTAEKLAKAAKKPRKSKNLDLDS